LIEYHVRPQKTLVRVISFGFSDINVRHSLWPPYGVWNMAGHYIFVLSFLLPSIFLLSFFLAYSQPL